MAAEVIDFQSYKQTKNEEKQANEQKGEYQLLKEIMTALFGPAWEDFQPGQLEETATTT